MAQGLGITVRPTHEQYKPLNAYVVSRPFLPLDEVPLFFSHFHSGSPSQYHDRLFLLSLLQQGLRTSLDDPLLDGRHVLQLVLSLHDSPLADPTTRRACLLVLLRAAERPALADALLSRHAVLGWAALTLSLALSSTLTLTLTLTLTRCSAGRRCSSAARSPSRRCSASLPLPLTPTPTPAPTPTLNQVFLYTGKPVTNFNLFPESRTSAKTG